MDIKYMKRAIEISKLGIGRTNPNPLVGAVIVKDNKVIGEGYHEYFGGAHAEVNAINNTTEDPKDSTMYVTLEPCSHYGKTPPCVNLIIKNNISKVVIGMKDPNPLVAGRGIQILKSNGIEVEVGVMEEEIKKINEIFIKYITTKRPFCILKTAITLDGKIATKTGDSKWITNTESRKYVHHIRNRVSGIMVGKNTIVKDNPLLTTRIEDSKGIDPARIIVDTFANIPIDSKVLNIESKAKTIIAVSEKADKDRLKALEDKGAQVLIIPTKNNRVDLRHLIKILGENNIDSLLIEGGATLNWSALNENIVDKVMCFIAPKIIGGKDAKTSIEGEGIEYVKDAIMLDDINIMRFNQDTMIEGYIRKDEQS